MSQYGPHLAVLAMVPSPLYVPIATTVWHWMRTRKR